MKASVSSCIIAVSLLASSSSVFANPLPICGSANDAMLGACTTNSTEISVFSAADLATIPTNANLPIIRYIGQEPLYEDQKTEFPILKTIPLAFHTEESAEQNTVSISILEDEPVFSEDFPIPYRSQKDAKAESTKGVPMKTIPVHTPEKETISKNNAAFVSRGEACMILAKQTETPIFDAANAPPPVFIFSDVNSETQFFSSINALKNIQAIDGYDDGSFKPEQNINFAEMYKMMSIAFGVSKASQETTGNNWYVPFKTALMNQKNISANLFVAADEMFVTAEEFASLLNELKK